MRFEIVKLLRFGGAAFFTDKSAALMSGIYRTPRAQLGLIFSKFTNISCKEKIFVL